MTEGRPNSQTRAEKSAGRAMALAGPREKGGRGRLKFSQELSPLLSLPSRGKRAEEAGAERGPDKGGGGASPRGAAVPLRSALGSGIRRSEHRPGAQGQPAL